MIASVQGTVLARGLDSAVVEVGGLGLRVQAAPATLAGLRVGERATLATSFVVREDSFTLYGFVDEDEREVFEKVQTVSGVGPRLALAMLAVLSPDALRVAVAAEDLKTLQRVPGIGKKGAQRIALELADKLGPVRGDAPAVAAAASSGPAEQVVEALVGLGWNARAAQDAVEQILAERSDGAGANVSELLRDALRTLGGQRG